MTKRKWSLQFYSETEVIVFALNYLLANIDEHSEPYLREQVFDDEISLEDMEKFIKGVAKRYQLSAEKVRAYVHEITT